MNILSINMTRRYIVILRLISVLPVFLFISCSAGSKSKLIGSQFSFHNQSRELSIHFISRDSLVIKNIFDCDIDSVYQSLDFKVGYSLKRKEIYLTDYEEYQLPYFENTSCFFLTEDYRKRQKRNYPGGPLVRDNDATLFFLTCPLYFFVFRKSLIKSILMLF
jgi:hypothetical protein